MSYNFMTLALHGMSISVPPAEELQSKAAVKKGTGRKNFFWGSAAQKTRCFIVPDELPRNVMTLELAREMLNISAMICVLYGATSCVHEYLDICRVIASKFEQLSLSGNDDSDHNAVGFVDRILDVTNPEYEPFYRSAMATRNSGKRCLSLEMSLRSIVNLSDIIKKIPLISKDSDVVDVRKRFNSSVASDIGGDDESSGFQSLAAVSYVQRPIINVDSASFGMSSDSLATMDRISIMICNACALASVARFAEAIELTDTIIELQRTIAKEHGGAMWRFIYLYKIWLSFVSGYGNNIHRKLDSLSCGLVVLEQNSLSKWIRDLRGLYKVLGTSPGGAVLGLEDDIRNIKSVLKSDRPSGCSGATSALAYALDCQPVEAVNMAKYSLKKLSTRKAITFVGPLFMFVAGYATAIAMELYAMELSQNESNIDRKYTEHKWRLDARRKSTAAIRRYEVAKECVIMALEHLRSTYKTFQPCVVLLYRALKIKLLVCDAIMKKTVSKIPFNSMMCEVKTAPFAEFKFGMSFLKLEKLNLRAVYSRVHATVSETDEGVNVVRGLFGSLGFRSLSLDVMGLFRFAPNESYRAHSNSFDSVIFDDSMDGKNVTMTAKATTLHDPGEIDRLSRLIGKYQPVTFADIPTRELLTK